MANNGTGYDKYAKGWYDEGDPAYSRSMRNRYAIEDSIDSNHYDWWEEKKSRSCFCEDEYDLCCWCDKRVTAEQARLESRRKYRDSKPPRDPGGPTRRSWRWRWWREERHGKAIAAAPIVETCEHIWVERERWIPRDGFTNYYTKVVRPPHMVLHRYWKCKDCRGEKGFGEVNVREPINQPRKYSRSTNVTREMTPQELKAFEEKKAKANRTHKSPKTYGVKEDGQPIYRNEFKQAEKKRLTRKREDD